MNSRVFLASCWRLVGVRRVVALLEIAQPVWLAARVLDRHGHVVPIARVVVWVVEKCCGDVGASGCGAVGQVEHQRQVQWVRPDREGFVQDPVAADAFGLDAAVSQVPCEAALADRLDVQGGCLGDQDVPVWWKWPGGPAMVEPGPQRPISPVAESLWVSGQGEPLVGQVDVVEREVLRLRRDGRRARRAGQ